MEPFHVFLHVRPRETLGASIHTVRGVSLRAIDIDARQLNRPFRLSFEEVVQRLCHLPRMIVEPDGSWVWVLSESDVARALNGMLYDRDGRLQSIELKGCCSKASLKSLLPIFGWPETELVFQDVRTGLILEESEFTRLSCPEEDACDSGHSQGNPQEQREQD
jgi:hypothetical protein